jgi:hypothetical protein
MMASEVDLAVLQEIKEQHESELLSLPNVVGVGIGEKVSDDKKTGDMAVVVYVQRKYAPSSLNKRDTVPKTLEALTSVTIPPTPGQPDTSELELSGAKVVTDVKEIGEIFAQAYTARLRPAQPGYSMGHFQITAGTFGAVVRDSCKPCQSYMLSNNHVFANSNAAAFGDPILQPGAFDGGTFPADVVARLTRFVPIFFGSPDRYNLVDAAIATPLDSRLMMASIVGIGIPKGTREAEVGMKVTKSGRTTQTTTGEVIDANATVAVNFGASGIAYFRHQVITTNMSQGGDSGSLLLSAEDQRAVGLLFAGSSVVTIHNHIKNVELALGIEVVTA